MSATGIALCKGLSVETRFRVARNIARGAKISAAIGFVALIALVVEVLCFFAFGLHLSFGWNTILFGVGICALLGAVVSHLDARDIYSTISNERDAT